MPAASRPLSLLGKRKSATQLVNQERVLQKRQRLAHVEEAVNTVNTLWPLSCSQRNGILGVFKCSKLVWRVAAHVLSALRGSWDMFGPHEACQNWTWPVLAWLPVGAAHLVEAAGNVSIN